MGEEMNMYKVLVRNQKERDQLEDQGVYGRMGAEWIVGRLTWGV
jgi:hypothetical protein